MTHQEALSLLQGVDIRSGDSWAELGAGNGTFSLALADLLGPGGFVYAIDKDRRALSRIRRQADMAQIEKREGDFTQVLDLSMLDGILMANALHYVEDQLTMIQLISQYLKPAGTFLLIEYDTEQGNPWVPYPISFKKFQVLAHDAGLRSPEKIGRHPSRYGYREIYAAVSLFDG